MSQDKGTYGDQVDRPPKKKKKKKKKIKEFNRKIVINIRR
jgi:hypothetical protein